MPCEELVEMCGVAGLDFVLIDCEHGPADVIDLRRHITVAQSRGMGALVRIGQGDPALTMRALDHGADGIVAPHIDDAQQAEELIRAVHYPPKGERGFATYSRAGDFGTLNAQEYRAARTAGIVVVVMLESPRAVHNAPDILGVTGVDGYLVGPSDLSMSRSDDDPSLEELTEHAHEVGRRLDVARADIVGTIAQATAARHDGAALVVYNLTQLLMALLKDAARMPPSEVGGL